MRGKSEMGSGGNNAPKKLFKFSQIHSITLSKISSSEQDINDFSILYILNIPIQDAKAFSSFKYKQ